jgi:HK97 family phage major capsid protein
MRDFPVGVNTVDGLTALERQSYSVVRAIRHLAGDEHVDAELECDVSKQISKQITKSTGGLYIPTRLRAGLDTKTGGAGGFTVATEVRDLIEILRNKSMVIRMGATVLSGLNSNVAFPVQLTATTASWVSQNPGSDVGESDATFGQKTMSPKTSQATTSFSRQLLAQASIDAEVFVRNNLAKAHALALDAACINGSGLSNQPLGLLKTPGIGDVALGANGAAPTYDAIVALETAIADANADSESMNFLTTPVMRSKLRKVQQFPAANGVPVWQQTGATGVGDVIGYRGYVSKQVPSNLVKGNTSDNHAIIFGDWPSLLIGEWGVVEILVDPFRLRRQGMLEVTSYQLADVLISSPSAFSAAQDARNV